MALDELKNILSENADEDDDEKICLTCDGTGEIDCLECDGTGTMLVEDDGIEEEVDCDSCNGNTTDYCPDCT